MTTETIVVAKAKLVELHDAVADMTAEVAAFKACVEVLKNLRRSQIRNAWGAGFRCATATEGYVSAREELDEYMLTLPDDPTDQ